MGIIWYFAASGNEMFSDSATDFRPVNCNLRIDKKRLQLQAFLFYLAKAVNQLGCNGNTLVIILYNSVPWSTDAEAKCKIGTQSMGKLMAW